MIDNLAERAKFWGSRSSFNYGAESVAVPYAAHEEIFKDARVLEIGPGDGRQFNRLSPVAKSYAVADISEAVLHKAVYTGVPRCTVLSYDCELVVRFDVVHAWYVAHHVKVDELPAFVGFMARHLVVGGLAYFNLPDGRHPDAKANDGIGTTSHRTSDVLVALNREGLVIEDVEPLSYECLCILARKK